MGPCGNGCWRSSGRCCRRRFEANTPAYLRVSRMTMASTDAQLRASEIKDVLLRQIEQYGEELQVEEVGEVLEVKDGVARIYGLTSAMASEMLEITSSESGEKVIALALNLEEDNIGSVVMGDW